MALYLGSEKVAVTNTIEKQVPSMKAYFEAGGKCQGSKATSFEGCWQYDDTANVTDMESMFEECKKLKTISSFDTSNVKSFYRMFLNCQNLKKVPLLNTVNATSMELMFQTCMNLITVPLFNTSNVTNMSDMFFNCYLLQTVPQFDTSKVTDMGQMFINCRKLTVIPKFDILNVTRTSNMLNGCSSLEAIHMININANLDIHYSTKFTSEALLEIIGNLKPQTSGNKTLTMGSTNLAKLTDEDKATATNKGWTLA